jgi:protein-disulfide isomerase
MSVLFAGDHLVEGTPKSSVRVVIYEDLQCPDCADFRRMLDEKLLPAYSGKVAFEHRDFPLAKHAWARKAAIAARFFQEVNSATAIAYRRETMASLRQINVDNFNGMLSAFAKSHSLDPAKAFAALEDPRLAALVEADFQEGIARGIARTPTALVNGHPFIESFSVEEISKTIDAELAAAVVGR